MLNEKLVYSVLMKGMQILGGALIVKVLTNTLTISDFGKYSFIVALSTFLAVIPFTGINQGVFRFIKSHDNKLLLYNSVLYLYLFILIFNSILFALSLFIFNADLYMYSTILILISSVFLNSLFWVDNAFEKQKKMFILYALDTLFKTSLLLLLNITEYINTVTALFAISISTVFLYIYGSYEYFRFKGITFIKSILVVKPLWLYAKPIVIWSMFTWAQTMIYRIYLTYFETNEAVALFTLNSSLAIMPISGIIGVVSAYVLPKLFVSENNTGKYNYYLLNKVTLLIAIALAFSIIILSLTYESVVVLFSSEEYRESSWMFPVMYISQCFYCLGTIYSYRLYAEKRTKHLMLANVIPGLLAILGGYFCISNYKTSGAIISFVISWSVCGFLLIYLTNLYSKGKEI